MNALVYPWCWWQLWGCGVRRRERSFMTTMTSAVLMSTRASSPTWSAVTSTGHVMRAWLSSGLAVMASPSLTLTRSVHIHIIIVIFITICRNTSWSSVRRSGEWTVARGRSWSPPSPLLTAPRPGAPTLTRRTSAASSGSVRTARLTGRSLPSFPLYHAETLLSVMGPSAFDH